MHRRFITSQAANFIIPLKFLRPISHLHNSSESIIPSSQITSLSSEKNPASTQREQLYNHGTSVIEKGNRNREMRIQVSHPWPEWIELMERLYSKGYLGETGVKDSNSIRTACLNFARDRFDLMRFFSKKEIQVIIQSGCPNIDRKVVNSGKRLRAYLGICEGDVCSACALRGNCERAYVEAREDQGGRTVDVMRFLLSYGLGETNGSIENMRCLNNKVKDSVRRLIKEIVDSSIKEMDSEILSSSRWNSFLPEHLTRMRIGQKSVPMKQGDWLCPNCNFMNFAKNIKCLRCNGLCQERLQKLGEDQDHLPLKKGDWLCDKCNFLNFAKNSRCLQCKEKPPQRELNPGEWECDSCNYINFRRNMVCLKCDYRRPKAPRVTERYSEAHCEDADFHQTRPRRFTGDDTNGRTLYGSKQNPANVWSFVDVEDSNYKGSNSTNEISGSVDFPITGGKSFLSDNAEKRETWKAESKHSDGGSENVGYTENTTLHRISESLENADDEEMADWFGRGKMRR